MLCVKSLAHLLLLSHSATMYGQKKAYKIKGNKRECFVTSRRDMKGGCARCIAGGNITMQPFAIPPDSHLRPNSNPVQQGAMHNQQSGIANTARGNATPVYVSHHTAPQWPRANLNQLGYPNYYAPQGINGADQKTIGAYPQNSRENGLHNIGYPQQGSYYQGPRGGLITNGYDLNFPAPPNVAQQAYVTHGGRVRAVGHPHKRLKTNQYGGCVGMENCNDCDTDPTKRKQVMREAELRRLLYGGKPAPARLEYSDGGMDEE